MLSLDSLASVLVQRKENIFVNCVRISYERFCFRWFRGLYIINFLFLFSSLPSLFLLLLLWLLFLKLFMLLQLPSRQFLIRLWWKLRIRSSIRCYCYFAVHFRMSFYRYFMRCCHFHRCHVSIFAFISSFLFRQPKVSTHFRINRINHTYKTWKTSFFMLDTITNHCSQILKFENIFRMPTMNGVCSPNKSDFGRSFLLIHHKTWCREKWTQQMKSIATSLVAHGHNRK